MAEVETLCPSKINCFFSSLSDESCKDDDLNFLSTGESVSYSANSNNKFNDFNLDDLLAVNDKQKCENLNVQTHVDASDNITYVFDALESDCNSLKLSENVSKKINCGLLLSESCTSKSDNHISLDHLAERFLKGLSEGNCLNVKTNGSFAFDKTKSSEHEWFSYNEQIVDTKNVNVLSTDNNNDERLDLNLCVKQISDENPSSSTSVSIDSGFCDNSFKAFDTNRLLLLNSSHSLKYPTQVQNVKASLLASGLSCKRKPHESEKNKKIMVNFLQKHYSSTFVEPQGASERVSESVIDLSNKSVWTNSYMIK